MEDNRSVDTLNKIINEFLKKHSLFSNEAPWIIKKSQLRGFGVFANRDIQAGETIFKDHPILIGPRAVSTQLCVTCYNKENLYQCKNHCGLLVCSSSCQNSSSHREECKIIQKWNKEDISDLEKSKQLMQCLAPVKALLLSDEDKEIVRNLKAHVGDQHGFEVDILKNLSMNIKQHDEDFMRFVCAVLDANAFEVIIGNEDNQSSLKGLYPLASLANHCCVPNTFHVFDKDKKMVVRAAVDIPKGSELFHSYSRFIWGTITRRFHLYRTKHFLCRCERCSDPSEFGTYMSSILCKKCHKGIVVPINDLQVKKWKCLDCDKVLSNHDVGTVLSILGSTLSCLEDTDLKFTLKFLNEKLLDLVPKYNQVVIELKYKTIWILGYSKGYEWNDLSHEHLWLKEEFCRDLLNLLDALKLGFCKIRGLLYYELYKTLSELKNRLNGKNAQTISDTELRNYIHKSAFILMYDVSAPMEVQEEWNKIS